VPKAYQWALPEGLDVPPDELRARLDFYQNAAVLHLVEGEKIITRVISARDVTLAFLSRVPLGSGLLPKGALWWRQGKEGAEIGLWEPPKVRKVALVVKPLEPPRRFELPMPGLIFVCSPGKPPRVFAAKKRPRSAEEVIYHAPLFNLFPDGRTCPGTHSFPERIEEIPDSFFRSFFSMEASHWGRSRKYPENLLKLWEDLEGRRQYPVEDLVPFGKLTDIMERR